MRKLSFREWAVLSVVSLGFLLLTAVAVDPIAEQAGDLSDALWWQLLPWVLIVLFWVWIVGRLRQKTSRTRDGSTF